MTRLALLIALSVAALAQTPVARVLIVDVRANAGSVLSAPAVIDRNEAAAIDNCLAYVDAQSEHLRSAADFAQRIRSTPGTRDGLFWPLNAAGEESPLGPKFAAAAVAEQGPGRARPLFGYYFRVLAGQGLLAFPAEYRVSGARSFLVNHLGEVYAKDLGPETRRSALGMTELAPDRTWTKVASATD